MAAPSTVAEFIDLLAESGLLEPAALEHYRRLIEAGAVPGDDPSELARLLVREGQLTRFQAGQLLLGTRRGFVIGKYKVLDQIGSGGMARIFLGEHRQMRHRVAIKVLPPARSKDPSARERFYREARAIAALHHPNIIRAHDIDRDGDLHFLVMEYVDGPNLEELVRRQGPLGPADLVRYLRQAALGLQHAFECGLVHRDIKPSNLLIDRTGTVKILDLGLARFILDESDDLSQRFNERVLGTADYLAPEQAEESHKVDIRADIYSLGCTAYYCLTGQPPFPEGSYTQKLIWHQVREPKPIAEFRDDVPAGLIAVIEKMMAKEPAQRYQTPAEVVAALTASAQDSGLPATWETAITRADATRVGPPARATQRVPLPRPRRLPGRWLAVGGVGLVAVLVAAAILLGRSNQEPPPPAPVAPPAAVTPPPPQVPVPRLVLQCGKGRGGQQEELRQPGFGYQLLQGQSWDQWPQPVVKSYCWFDPVQVRCQLRLPAGKAATLRLHFVDGDARNRQQRLIVQGRTITDLADFTGAGKHIEVHLPASDIQDGRIEIVIQKLNAAAPNAVISTIELLTP